jgi:hypothetical protein
MNSTTSSKNLIRTAALGALMLGSLLWSGCTSLDLTANIPMDAVARLSPVPQLVTPNVALDSAQQYVKDHPGSDFAVGSGDSMMPLYHDRAVIIMERPAMSRLQIGQTVVFLRSDGIPVAHILVKHTTDGWMTRGLNNQDCDPGILSDRAYVGVVVKAYQPTASVILAYSGASTRNSLASVQ